MTHFVGHDMQSPIMNENSPNKEEKNSSHIVIREDYVLKSNNSLENLQYYAKLSHS